MITKTNYVLDIDELKEALETFLNRNEDEQYGTFIGIDLLHKIEVVKDSEGTITAVEFHTESSDDDAEESE